MTKKVVKVSVLNFVIIQYPGALMSTVYGISEIIEVANQIAKTEGHDFSFRSQVISLVSKEKFKFPKIKSSVKNIIILPPSMGEEYYLSPDPELLLWLKKQYSNGVYMASACAGAFIIAAAFDNEGETMTTHWGLSDKFKEQFPNTALDTQKILIDEGRIITAGGMMSWTDLIFHLMNRFGSHKLVQALGRYFVIDIVAREQRSYSVFTPRKNHKNLKVLEVQKYIEGNLEKTISIENMAKICGVAHRTFQRHFKESTGINPHEYIQNIRVQKACDLLESKDMSIQEISYEVGYLDIGAFRKVFYRKTGLTPKEFRVKWS
jgi:transcriptional regulator GlxA family with amidase domain